MKYTKFTIKNYKGIKEIELDLAKKPESNIFTLVGLNESGKTTLLEAIFLFQKGISKEEAHTLIPKSMQHSFNDKVSIKAELELSSKDLDEIKNYLEKEHKFILEEGPKKINITYQYSFTGSVPNEDNWIWQLDLKGRSKKARKAKNLQEWDEGKWEQTQGFIKEKIMPKILYYPDFLFKFPEKIYLEQYEGEGKEQEKYRDVISDILQSIGKKLTIKDNLLKRVQNKNEGSHKQALEQLLIKISNKLNQEILKKWDTIFKGTSKKEVRIQYDIESNKYFIELKIEQEANSYSINDRSLGFRWFFSFLIFTTFRKSRIEDPGETLFLLDEPASNLHQRSQQKLLESLKNIFSNCQLIYSTHSHHLIDPKWLGGTYIVRNKAINYSLTEESSATDTDISAILYKNFVSKHSNEEDHFKPILDSLDYTPSQLQMVPPIIFTEGKNDYYVFKYMMMILKKEKDYKLNFYPGAGVNKYDAPFRLYLAWNKKFIALFDSDKAGKKAKKDYIKTIGPDIENKIFTFEEIDQSWKNFETEQLFSEKERINIIKNCFSDYNSNNYNEKNDKTKFNTAIQKLFIHNKKYDFERETLNKFKKIFKFLETKINKLS